MPLQLDIKRKLTARSDRVKGIDQHPTEPWILCCLYNGDVNIWNYETQMKIKQFEVCDLPVRAAKFVTRKNFVITGSDDMMIRVFNYNTLERVQAYEAHSDYIRSIAVHPTMPYVLTCSDDLLIKLWNWDTWACQQVFEGHTHYVMQIIINPKDTNTFASASLDRTVKVWQLGSAVANFTLDGHEKGVNCIDYYHGGDKPYLISGADDRCVKIWDYQNKTCVQSLEGHSQNVTAVAYHPELPLLMTGSEDGVINLWHAGTYRLESTLHYGLERVWVIAASCGSHNVAIGYDEGTVMIKVGRDEPAISMDVNGGKIVWAKHSEMQQTNLKALREESEVKDGENMILAVKDMGSCDLFPQTLAHNSNGRFVVVCGDDEYIIYTAMALRNKAFGAAQQFVWALDSSEYATLNNSYITVYKNFKERQTLKPAFNVEGIYGGHMLGVRSVSGSSLTFYDWEYLELIRRIDIHPRQVYWSESGKLVCLTTDDSYFILQFKPSKVAEARAGKIPITDDGIEEAFEVISEISEKVKTGVWVEDCFIYNDSMNRLCYYVGGEIVTVCNLERTMYILGYVAKDDRLYLNDKDLNIVSYSLLLSVLQYQTAVMRKDFKAADIILPNVPLEQRTRVAHFLEKQGFYSQALAVATEPDHRFDLSVPLGMLEIAKECAEELDAIEGTGSNSSARWTRLGNAASLAMKPGLTKYCYKKANDYGSLILYATSTGDKQLLEETAMIAEENGQCNVAFLSLFTLGKLDECLTILVACERLAEASFFARSYVPSRLMEVSTKWRRELAKTNPKAAQSLADPENYDNLFPEYNESLKLEQFQKEYNHEFHTKVENNPVNTAISNVDRNLAEEMAAAERSGAWTYRGASARTSTVDLLSSPSTSTSSQISVMTAIPTTHAIPISPTIPISPAIPISPISTSTGKPSASFNPTSLGIPTASAIPTSSFIPTSPTRIAPNIPISSSNTSSPLSLSPSVSSSPGASTSPSIPTPPTVPTTPNRSIPARSAPAVPDLSAISANLEIPLEPTRLATGIPAVQQNIPNEPELASGSSQIKEKPKAIDDKDNEFMKFMDELEKEIDEGLTDTFDDALDIADILEEDEA